MHLVRASYVPKRKLPYPSACCLYCLSTVCGTRGSREQHQVAVSSRQGTVALAMVVGHLLTSYQQDACCRECRAVCWWASIDHYRETLASSVRSLCKPLRYRVHVWLWRQRASWIAASTAKASKGAPSMVHHVGRAPGHEGGQGIE